MTLIACSIAIHAADEVGRALERAVAAVKTGASLIEWRIDALAEEPQPLFAVGRLVRESPAPCIVTCRTAEEGGEFRGDELTRISLFEALVMNARGEPGPRYLDVELAAYRRSENLKQKINLAVAHPGQARDLHTSLILSSHDFSERPRDLLQRIEAMTNEPACAVIKVAWHARSLRDNLEAFDILSQRRKPTIALCMGQFGLMSRVLAPKFGGFLTFATDHPAEVTAPGQPTVDELLNRFRFNRITADTRVYGVIGWPVEHSKSPAIHNAGFKAIGFDGVYLPLPIPSEYEHFKATVGSMIDHPRLNFRGASVTIPHKEHLLRFVRERGGRIDPLTDRIGAANTLIVGSAGGLECTNTDCPAAVQALCAGMGIVQRELAGKRIAVIGAGGVARAAVAGLSDCGATVVVFNRRQDRAESLAAGFNSRWTASGTSAKVSAGTMEALACGCFHVFVNCTPVGMAGTQAEDESPLPPDVTLDDTITVFDTVYAPPRTPLIEQAQSRGARVVSGLDMFARQAAMQFERWTGATAPLEVFSSALQKTQ